MDETRFETDIYKTADGKFVIGHNDNYKRLSGEEIFLEKETLERLRQVVFFDKDGTKNRVDLRPATLENYLSIVKKYEKHAVLELKSNFTDEEIARIIEIIREYDYLDNLTFISFNYDNLLRVRKILPNQSAQYLFWKITDAEIERLVRDKIDVDVWVVELTKEQIEACHRAGLKVNCWTVDDPKKAEELEKQAEKERKAKAAGRTTSSRSHSTSGRKKQSAIEKSINKTISQTANTIGRELGKQLVRGLLGTLKK